MSAVVLEMLKILLYVCNICVLAFAKYYKSGKSEDIIEILHNLETFVERQLICKKI